MEESNKCITIHIPMDSNPTENNKQCIQLNLNDSNGNQTLQDSSPPTSTAEISPKSSSTTTTNTSKQNPLSSSQLTRFKWTKEKSQVALNLVKHGCKPKLVAVAVGCSLRTAQKFVETVTPKIEGQSFVDYEIKRRGRKSKDVNQRLDAIKEVLSKDSSKTQVEIAADLKVSNTTVCRDLKRIGASWKENKHKQPPSKT